MTRSEFVEAVLRYWADNDEINGGDFVEFIGQLIDLLPAADQKMARGEAQ